MERDRGRRSHIRNASVILFTHRTAFAELLGTHLESRGGFRGVAAVANAAGALAAARRQRGAIALLDGGLPAESAFDLARKLAAARTPVVMLFDADAEGWISRALEAGVCGFLGPGATCADIARALRAAAEGRRFITPGAGRILADLAGPSPSVPRLSPREMAVLARVCQGLSTKEISRKLNLQPKAIDEIRLRLMAKTRTARATALVRYACAERLIDLRPRWEQLFGKP